MIGPLRLPALVTIAVGGLLATQDGGFGGGDWYPAALFLLALLALTVNVAPPARMQWPRPLTRALIALAGFSLWALSSALWSDVPGAAWDGANRAVLYGIVLALVTLRRWPVREYALALGLVAGGVGALAIGVLVECAVRAHPAALFIASRLIEPVGYANASLWLIGLWPAVALACRRRLHWAVRSVSLGVACVLLETSLLSVSRGAVASIAVTAVVLLAVADARWKLALGLLAVGGAAALAVGPLLAVSASTTVAELDRALPPALAAIAWTSALVACLGAAAIAAGRRVESAMAPDARLTWRTRLERLLALLGAVAVVVALVGIGNPATWAGDRWHDFKTSGYTQVTTGPGRLTGSLGSGRYDYYRVALDEFRKRPLTGVGYESFQVAYLAQRRTDETPASRTASPSASSRSWGSWASRCCSRSWARRWRWSAGRCATPASSACSWPAHWPASRSGSSTGSSTGCGSSPRSASWPSRCSAWRCADARRPRSRRSPGDRRAAGCSNGRSPAAA